MIDLTNAKFSDFWQWVKETFTVDYRSEIEHYLNQSYDYADLERRIKLLRIRGVI